MILSQGSGELTQLLQELAPEDRNAVLLVVGTAVAAVAGRLVVVLLLSLLKALVLAAVVAAALWVGVQALDQAGTAERVVAPTEEIPTIGPLAPR